ncbi:DUF4214 domain-containing protein [Subtercola sp. PAMC28395]|uniref:DUF4214 domain-containing protein n=1 Tax=Subtercola sp. PAMC28395 TaxID=2846775 RepID=UPI001C0B678D|nr:DUF4214 domain-containing protein [Subtercola sp. PAMC28395]QWT23035.1 DUF4214 domain-containing protein [Subtercola sp. PAMC28395]
MTTKTVRVALTALVSTALVLSTLVGSAGAMAAQPVRASGDPAVASTIQLAPRDAFVTSLYADFLGRQPSPDEVGFWSTRLAAGAPRRTIADSFANSDEYRLIRITATYRTVLGRDPDPTGESWWLDALRRGVVTTDDMSKAFYNSDEFYARAAARYNAPPNDGAFVDALYASILGREAMGLEGFNWLNAAWAYTLGRFSAKPFLIDAIYDSTEAARDRVQPMYQQFLGRIADEGGLEWWASLDLRIGDSAVRGGFSGSDEYYSRAVSRYP